MKFKVGDRVIVTENVSDFEVKGRSGVIKDFESHEYDCTVEFDDNMGGHTGKGNCKNNHGLYVNFNVLKLVDLTQTIVIYTKGNVTTATLKNGNTAIKTAIATCNPSDKFSFGIGARVALDRLMGEEVKEVKELTVKAVHRVAKFGEWIRIEKELYTFNKIGDILPVSRATEGLAFVNAEDHPRKDVNYGEWNYGISHYVVLENYTPSEQPTETTEPKLDLSKVPGVELFAEIQRRVNL